MHISEAAERLRRMNKNDNKIEIALTRFTLDLRLL